MGPAVLAVDRGVLFPATLSDGRRVEAVFIGQARFRLTPPDEIEAGQLDLFTGERTLDAAVEEAVIVLPVGDTMDRLFDRPAPNRLRPELILRAHELHERWLDGTERRTPGIDAAMFKALIGDEAFANYFAIWCRGFDRGDFLYQYDPEQVEQIILASFQPLEMTNWERRTLRHQIRIQRRKGRWLRMRVEDIGSWDIWVSMPWSPANGSGSAGSEGFEAQHYALDVTIDRKDRELQGRARLRLETVRPGRRMVRLALMTDLLVEQVTDAAGQEMFFFRSGEEIAVLLPEAPEVGEEFTLEVAYAGQALAWADKRTYDLTETGEWYPHCGTVDRATYDVTLRWPRRYQLFASGALVDSGKDHRYAWERRRLDLPAIAFSFVMGQFEVEHRRMGHVDVTMAFHKSPTVRPRAQLRDRTLKTVEQALDYFETTFGPYPMDELTLVTMPRSFSQSYLGFIALASSSMGFDDPTGSDSAWRRETTIAHELAHQWWGNQVGWWSYRDQWLSEAMANYSALLFDSHLAGDGSEFLSVMSAGWRDSLTLTTHEGRTIESLGPIVLGNRLNSSRASNGYGPIVYRKGAVVLAMLSRAVGEEHFKEMLRSLVEAATNEVLTTKAFLLAIERMSGLELDGFASKFIYGTGIPQVYYTHELTQDEGTQGWVLEGEARLLRAPSYRARIVKNEDSWDLVHEPLPELHAGPTTLMVPYRLTLDASTTAQTSSSGRRTAYGGGQIFLEGKHDRFRIDSAERPIELQLDPRGEILARFYSAELHPRRFLRLTAEDLAIEGKHDEAERRYREALDTTVGQTSIAARGSMLARRMTGPGEEGRIRLSLARLLLDQARHAEAEAELDAADVVLDDAFENLYRVERNSLRSRLDVQRGNYASARRRLKKMLRIADRPRGSGSWRSMVWQLQLNSERQAMTEAYSLLAICARELDRPGEFDWAVEEATNRGVDVRELNH